jgi:hypothetical protein
MVLLLMLQSLMLLQMLLLTGVHEVRRLIWLLLLLSPEHMRRTSGRHGACIGPSLVLPALLLLSCMLHAVRCRYLCMRWQLRP